MNTFKIKERKKKPKKVHRSTFDVKVNERLEKYENDFKVVLPQKISEKTKLEKKINTLKKKKVNTNPVLALEQSLEISRLEQKRKELEKEIKTLSDRTEYNKYLMDTADIFVRYEQANDQQRAIIYSEYLRDFEGQPFIQKLNDSSCKHCGGYLILGESDYTCVDCGTCSNMQLTGDDTNIYEFSDGHIISKKYVYQRPGHLNDWICRLTASETTDVPEEVYDAVRSEIRKHRIKDPNKITYTKIKGFLNKLKLEKYYENVYTIMSKITGIPPPKISDDLKEKLFKMFYQIQEPFETYKRTHTDRQNMLSYGFIIEKICQILGEDDLIRYLPTLKSRDHLYSQERIWRFITEQLEWEYISSL